MKDKVILIGEIEENISGTPIEKFLEAIDYSKKERWVVKSNDPQFVEALEVLCNESDIDVFLFCDGKFHDLTFQEAYNYLGEIYNIINAIRFRKDLNEDLNLNDDSNYNMIMDNVKEYKKKWFLDKDEGL